MSSVTLGDINPRFLWLDPASGKNKQKLKSVRARSAIIVVGTDPYGRIFVLDAWADRVGTTEIVRNFNDMVEKWSPLIAAYEDVGQQSLLEDPLMVDAGERGIELPLAPITVSTKVDKNWRIRSILQPIIGAGRLIIRDDLEELKNEITSFPMSAIKDLIDSLASCCALVPPVLSEGAEAEEAREIARYLRESGTPPREIERRMDELGGAYDNNVMPAWQRELFFRRSM